MIDLNPHRNGKGNVYLLWRPENDETIDDAREVLAFDAEEAAEDWAANDDTQSADYSIVRGNEATVCVRLKDDESAPVETFVVYGESVPQYSAQRKS